MVRKTAVWNGKTIVKFPGGWVLPNEDKGAPALHAGKGFTWKQVKARGFGFVWVRHKK